MTRLFVLGLSAATAALLLQLPWPPTAAGGRLTPQHRRAAPPGPHLRGGGDRFKNRRQVAAPYAGAGSSDYKEGVEEGAGGQGGSSSGSQKGNRMSMQRKYDASYHRSASKSQSAWAGQSQGVSTGNKGGKDKAKGGGAGSGMKNGMGAGGRGGSLAGGGQVAEKGGGKGIAKGGKGGQRRRHHGRKKSGAARAKGGKRRGKGPGMATAKGGEMPEKKKVPQSYDDDDLQVILCSNPAKWGQWSEPTICEEDNPEHVMIKFRIRLQPYQGERNEDDDTSMNAIEMHCSNGAQKIPHSGFFGTWLAWSPECPGGFNGMAVKFEDDQGAEDDTAQNCVRFYCPHPQSWMEPPTCGHRGRWYDPVYCEENRRISGMAVRTQQQIVGDNTVTNDIAVGCTLRPVKKAAKGKAGAPDYGQDYDDGSGNSTAAAAAAPKRRLQGRKRYRLGNREAAGERRMRGNATDTSAAAGNDYYYYGE